MEHLPRMPESALQPPTFAEAQQLVFYDISSLYTLRQESSQVPEGSRLGDSTALITAAPDGISLAVSPAASATVYLFSRKQGSHHSETPQAVFDPRLEAKIPVHSGEEAYLTAWSADSSKLAFATSMGSLFLVTREGQLVGEWSVKAWRAWAIVGLCFDSDARTTLLLTSKGLLYAAARTDTAPQQILSLKSHHHTVRCMTFDAARSELIIAGTAGKGIACPSLTAWQLQEQGSPVLCWQLGMTSRSGWRSSTKYGGWILIISPAGDKLAVGHPGGAARIYDLQALRSGQQEQSAIIHGEFEQIAWWSEAALATISSSGGCSIQSLTADANLLTPAPRTFAPGTAIACQQASSGVPRRLVALHHEADGQGWSLTSLAESSATAKLQQLLLAEQWEAALLLAESHNLDADLVRKALWERQDVSSHTIEEFWMVIEDRHWAIQNCLERTASSEMGQRLLMQAGLQETATHLAALLQGVPDAAAEDDLWWQAQRIRLLQHLDRLAMLTKVLHSSYSPGGFADLRDGSLVEVASVLASSGDLASLRALLGHSPYAIAPRLLDILACLPETLPPAEWMPLIKEVATREVPMLARDPDAAESAEAVSQLRQAGEYALLVATEPLAQLTLGWKPPSNASVVRWLEERIKQIDTVTGQLTIAAKVLEAGQALVGGDDRLALLQARVAELQDATAIGGGMAWNIRLDAYARLDLTGRLQLLLDSSHIHSIEEDRQRLKAVLSRLPAKERGPQLAVLLAQQSSSRLFWCCELVKVESEQLQCFPSAAALAEAVLTCVYAFPGQDKWATLGEAIALTLRAFEGSIGQVASDGWEQGSDEEDPKTEHLMSQLQQASRHVQGAEQLAGMDMAVTMAEVRDCSRDKALSTLRTLLARLSRAHPSESRWTETWRQLRVLQDTAWPFLTKQELLAELCRSLLLCGEWKLARSYLTGTGSTPIPQELAEELVVTAAKEFFYSAPSLDAAEVQQAQQCLGVLPDNPAALTELNAIRAVLRLRELGVEMLPMQLQQVEDRMDIVQSVLDARLGAYADRVTIMSLAGMLGLAKQSSELSLRIATTAMREEDMQTAHTECLKLVKAAYQPAWELAAQLALLGQGGGALLQESKDLLGFAMAHCPPGQVQEFLHLWHGAPWQPVRPAEPLPDTVLGSLRHTISQPGMLPEFGDAAMALDCLLRAEERGGAIIEGALQDVAGSYAASRRLMLLGLVTSAFQVLVTLPHDDLSVNEAARLAEQHLLKAPWVLHGEICRLDDATLPQEAKAAQATALHWGCRLKDAADERRMESWLPTANGDLDNGENGSISRQAALMQVAAAAGRLGPDGEGQLGQALVLAGRYGADSWQLHMVYLRSLLIEYRGPVAAVAQLAQSTVTQLASRPQEALQQVAEGVYAKLEAQYQDRIALCLRLMAHCLPASDSGSLQALQAAAEFAEHCSAILPDLDAKVFIAPLAEQITSTVSTQPQHETWQSHSQQMLAEAAAHMSTPSAADLGQRVAELASAGENLGLEKRAWPTPSALLLLAFCKEISPGPRSRLPERYSQAAALLPCMDPEQISAAVGFIALGGLSPNGLVKPLGRRVARSVRLQALTDGLQLLQRSAVEELAKPFEAPARLLRRVLQAAEAAQLSSAEQDCLEAALTRQADLQGAGVASALQQLLFLGVPLSRIEHAAESLLATEEEEPPRNQDAAGAVLDVISSSVSAVLQRLDEQASDASAQQREQTRLDATAKTLEDGTALQLKPARDLFWALLQSFLLKHPGGGNSLTVVELLHSLPSFHGGTSRWQSWQPAGEGKGSAAAVSLWAQTLALLQPGWQGALSLQPEDLVSGQAAQALFMRLLGNATQPAQLELLGRLLTETWKNGAAFANAESVMPRASEATETYAAGASEHSAATHQGAHLDVLPTDSQQDAKGAREQVSMPHSMQADAAVEGWLSGDDVDLDLALEASKQQGEPDVGVHIPKTEESEEQLLAAGSSGQDGWEGSENLALHGGLDMEDNPKSSASPDESRHQDKPNNVQLLGEQSGAESGGDLSALHSCWAALLEKQLAAGLTAVALRTIDQSTIQLVTQTEAADILETSTGSGHADGITLALLLPYAELHETAMQRLLAQHHHQMPLLQLPEGLLLLLLAKGLFPALQAAPCFPALCEHLLACSRGQSKHASLCLSTWQGMLLPAAAAQMTLAGCWDMASGLVARQMGLHPALINRDNGRILLPKFLAGHLRRLLQNESACTLTEAPLPRVAMQLQQQLDGLYRQAQEMLRAV